ncbi:hypothetical protein NOK12_04700 [Nocardioides sp. OK12]|uniref:hypothetical protein n=1 Tax=Nocardioides sp. OK12 TaxID=2758661 RepID=UPI0021C3D68F|nr:hypothetical protein [Nocardioides sp. OK12]GHJ57951.1 hypothetical protein NOK12_04700 [Nocardioides sp. OK12]
MGTFGIVVVVVVAVLALAVLGVDLLLSRRQQRGLGSPERPGTDSDLLGHGSASRGAAYGFSRGHGLLNKRERRSR